MPEGTVPEIPQAVRADLPFPEAEAVPPETDLQEEILAGKGIEYYLLQGLAGLLCGRSNEAKEAFSSAQKQAPQDILPLLGLGTAAVIDADDETAQTYYRQALQIEPENKTAKKNLKVLEEE